MSPQGSQSHSVSQNGADTAPPPAAFSASQRERTPMTLNLDSAYLTAFELAHETLRRGLSFSSPLTITQYRVLAKLAQAKKPINQGELGELLLLKPNVITQALDALVAQQFARRSVDPIDGRRRYSEITADGLAHIAEINETLTQCLYQNFPTNNVAYRTILEASIEAAARIEPPLSPVDAIDHQATNALIAVELIRQETEAALIENCGASLAECRIVQYLLERKEPLRVGILARELFMSPVTVARGSDHLVDRGWVQKLSSPYDRKAVFVRLSTQGVKQGQVICDTVNELGKERIWSNLTSEQCHALESLGQVVMADRRALAEAQNRAQLKDLKPLRPKDRH